jgi:GAF domain
MTLERKRPKSERPPGALKQQREAFLKTFVKKGVQLTEELVTENAKLRKRLGDLEAKNAVMRAQLASDDAIRELMKRIDSLEREKKALLSRFEEVEAESSRWGNQYYEVEQELSNLVSLYVAGTQLHGSLDLPVVLSSIRDVVVQLVGARAFTLYVVTRDEQSLFPILSEGVGSPGPIPIVAHDGGVGEVFSTAVARIEQGDPTNGSVDRPAALIPMKVEDKVIGVLAIFATLEQKSQFSPMDFELMQLLGAQAGTALVSARMFADLQGRWPSFQNGSSDKD